MMNDPTPPRDPALEKTAEGGGSRPADPPGPPDSAAAGAIARGQMLGHFQILDKIGEGGMGLVHRALDTKLNRHVAVKVLRKTTDEARGSQGRRRFLTEARITGQLQHPGIPPVHDLGQLDDGRPYLAMKLVKGRTLHEILRGRTDRGDDPGRYVPIFEQICYAVGYAHDHQVIHRDLKPSNVMVGSHGEVQVMDWGLAKVLGGESETEPAAETKEDDDLPATVLHATAIDTPEQGDSATRTGQALGTPAYMAPEQAGGEVRRLDPRCDVFGLGAILCEILTGKPPYTGKDAHNVLLKAVRGELDDAFARLDDCGADPELVALCRRCLAFDREERPADGNRVAAEVARIRQAAEERARQAELATAEALVREAEQRKRRRQVLAAAALIALVLAGGVVGTTIGMIRAQRSREAAELARRRAETSERKARRNQQRAIAERDAKTRALAELEVALARETEALASEKSAREHAMEALAFMSDDAVGQQLAGGDYIPERKRKYLEKVVQFYEGFARIRGEREEARAIQAEGYYRVAKLQFYLGQHKEAIEHLKRSVRLYEELVDDAPDEPKWRLRLVESLHELAWDVQHATSRYDEAEKAARKAIALGTALVQAYPDVPSYASALASSYSNLAAAYWKTSRYDEAIEEYGKAVRSYEKLAQQFPNVPEYANNLASSYSNLALVYQSTSRYDEAIEEYGKAIESYERLAQQFPDVPKYANNLASSYSNLALADQRMNRFDEAIKAHGMAIESFRKLVQQFPAVPEYALRLGDSHHNLGNVYGSTSRYGEAIEEFGMAITIRQELARQLPNVPEYASRLAASHNNVGNVYWLTSRYDEAIEEHRTALAIREKLAQKFPDVPGYAYALARSHNNLARNFNNTGRFTDAAAACTRAAEIIERLIEQRPRVASYKSLLRYVLANRCTALAGQQEREQGVAVAERLFQLGFDPPEDAYASAYALARAAKTMNGHAKRDAGARKEASAFYADLAMKRLHEAVDLGYENWKHMETDDDLDLLRDREDFQALMKRLRAKSAKEKQEKEEEKGREKKEKEKEEEGEPGSTAR